MGFLAFAHSLGTLIAARIRMGDPGPFADLDADGRTIPGTTPVSTQPWLSATE